MNIEIEREIVVEPVEIPEPEEAPVEDPERERVPA